MQTGRQTDICANKRIAINVIRLLMNDLLEMMSAKKGLSPVIKKRNLFSADGRVIK